MQWTNSATCCGLAHPAHHTLSSLFSCRSKKEAVAAGVTAAAAAVLANPMVAEAAVSPSLSNLLGSLVAGGFVLTAIAVAVTAVS